MKVENVLVVFVMVQLPDGSHKYCPVVKDPNAEIKVPATFTSSKEAINWLEFCLPEKTLIR